MCNFFIISYPTWLVTGQKCYDLKSGRILVVFDLREFKAVALVLFSQIHKAKSIFVKWGRVPSIGHSMG